MDDKTIVTPSGSIDISEDTNVVHPYELVTVPKKIHSMEDTNLKPGETIMSPNPGFTEEVDTADIASSNQTDTGDIDSFSRTDSGDISGLLQTDATKVSPTGKDNDMPELDSADEDITAKGISYDSMSGEGKKVSAEKTSVLFNIKDITSKVNAEIDDIPDDYNDELDIAHMSRIIKAKIPDRSEADKLKINRNFLLDAEPFNIEKLVEDIKKTPEGLISGFKCLDRSITIPPDSLTVVAGLPKHGKSCFMMNMMLNMCHEYKGKHFIYYTYEEPKWEVQTKMINMSGIKPFSKGLNSNIDRWKYEFKNTDINTLKLKGDREKEFRGLKNFIEISGRIHIIDSSRNIVDLVNSVKSFSSGFEVGAVFIDSLQRIRLKNEETLMTRNQQLQNVSECLRKLANDTRFPVIVSSQLTPGPKGSPEYDALWEDNLKEAGSPDQVAGLVLGLQNYSRSRFIGSNYNNRFKSEFYGQALERAQSMPDSLRDIVHKTILLVKVMSNKSGPEAEAELLFHKDLLKIIDFTDEFLHHGEEEH